MAEGFYNQIIEILKRHGCTFVRNGKGSHEIWFSPISKKNFSVPFSTKSRHTANAVLRQAGIETKI